LFPRLPAGSIFAQHLRGNVVQANCRKLHTAFLARFLLGRLNPSAFFSGLAPLLFAAVRATNAIVAKLRYPIAFALLAGHCHTSVWHSAYFLVLVLPSLPSVARLAQRLPVG